MNIPLDRLYHYIRDIAQEIYGDRIIIYRFWPHGSKNIADLNNLNENKDGSLGENEWMKKTISPLLWCNDQEPLDYEFYKTNIRDLTGKWPSIVKSFDCFKGAKNLNYIQHNIFKKALLLHSEKRSENLKQYQFEDQLISVYYWNHAIIARDWFRYGQHIKQKKNVKKSFLIYSRAWAGTREYRLRFAELLIQLNLQDHCQTTINPIEPELDIHYGIHKFKNTVWRPQLVLENYFPTSSADSGYSADFDIEDYESTDIEVVLETLFDDSRLHLTEKSLRPISCAQPFILAGTHGSLEYLRSYGFKTFNDVWDESYDLVEDPAERLIQIGELMKQISCWGPVRERKLIEAQGIAEYNKQHFFSKEFLNQIINELKSNLGSAFNELSQCNNYVDWVNMWKPILLDNKSIKFLTSNQNTTGPTQGQVDFVLELVQNKLKNNIA